MYTYQILMLYTLNLYSITCLSYINKAEGNHKIWLFQGKIIRAPRRWLEKVIIK